MNSHIALFGGTFDPVHQGHLSAITQLHQELDLAEVRWVLSAQPPHKDSVSASIENRLAMLELALEGNAHFVVDDSETKRAEPSYTYDTLSELRETENVDRITMIIGGDSFLDLPKWYRYPELLDLCNWVVLHRPGYTLKASTEIEDRICGSKEEFLQSESGRFWLYEESHFDVSSTEIRQFISNNRSEAIPTAWLDPQVFDYIKEQQLYLKTPMTPSDIKTDVVNAVEDIKGQDVRIIDIAEISDFADFMVVVSGTSDTHVKAIAREASDRLRKQGVKPLNEDGADIGEWVLVDFGDVVLHVMRPEVRDYYDLEKLWDEDVRAMVKQHREESEAE